MKASASGLTLALAFNLGGCFIYCPIYATGGCLTTTEIRDSRDSAELLEYLEDDRSWVRESAARSLQRFGGPEVARKLEARLMDRGEPSFVRIAAAESLGVLNEPESHPLMVGLLSDPDTDASLRIALIGAICRFHNSDVRPAQAVAPHLRSDDVLVAAVAARHLRAGCGAAL